MHVIIASRVEHLITSIFLYGEDLKNRKRMAVIALRIQCSGRELVVLEITEDKDAI